MKKFLSLLLFTLLAIGTSYAESNYNFNESTQTQTYKGTPLRGSVISVPAGSVVTAVTTSELSSDSLTKGQAVYVTLGSDFYFNNKLIAPMGSSVIGTVTELRSARHGSMNGKIKILFTQITTPQGIQIPIQGVIKTNDGTGVLVGGTKMDVTKAYAKDLAAGSAIGAISGVVFGALAGGSVGQGAALGTAVGAGGGLVKSSIDKGQPVKIPANSQIDIILNQPITVNPTAYSYEE